jgi:hypothetical protein
MVQGIGIEGEIATVAHASQDPAAVIVAGIEAGVGIVTAATALAAGTDTSAKDLDREAAVAATEVTTAKDLHKAEIRDQGAGINLKGVS